MRRKRRLLLLGPLPPPYGGVDVMTQALLMGLRERDEFEIKHVNTQISKRLAEKGGKKPFRKALLGIAQTIEVARALVTFRPDALYMPFTNSTSFAGFVRDALLMLPALLTGKRILVRLHGGHCFYADHRGIKRYMVRAVLGHVSLAIVQGRCLTGVFSGLIPADKIVVIPNGLDDKPFAEARAHRRELKVGLTRQVLFVGLLIAEKGFRDVIAAIPLVPDAYFVFAGEWRSSQEEQEVRETLKERGIENRVTFAGVVSGPVKYELFLSCDVFVFPTYFPHEGHSVSSVEALAAGLPIVCTDHGALNESVVSGWNGFFVPRSDPVAVAGRLNELLGNDELRRTMGEHSRRLYEERFTSHKYVGDWSNAIAKCLNHMPGPGALT